MKHSLPIIQYEIMQEAVSEEEKALEYVLDVFYPYIKKLATKNYIDEFGHYYSKTDHDLIAYIQSRLILEIIHGFQIRP